MYLQKLKNTVLFSILIGIVFINFSCGNKKLEVGSVKHEAESMKLEDRSGKFENNKLNTIIVGANQTENYLSFLKGKRVGIVANQTSVIFKEIATSQNSLSSDRQARNDNYTHLVDSLFALGINVKKVFAPEHGFRGSADAGEKVKDGIDTKTGLPIISLYGKNRKPSKKQLEGLDILIFDIQDVGARFYTYISSLHYIMEACAEQNIPMLILDRPNPNGHYIDGPILEMEHQSFIGMHPIPVVHGMTIGEYAKLINGEKWLKNEVQCDVTVIKLKNYSHNSTYSLPIKPSPNLPNDKAINLYPSLCFFEGTNVSAGRGTTKQFQIFGSPYLDKEHYEFKFIPSSKEGAKYPKHETILCYGKNLSDSDNLNHIDLSYLIEAYQNTLDKPNFFIAYFTKLAGTKILQSQIENGLTEAQIKASWKDGLDSFKLTRKKYLLYD